MSAAYPETMGIGEFARLLNRRQSYISQLKKEGRLVLSGDGRRVRVAESIARIQATSDPSRQGVAQRHAMERRTKSMSRGAEVNDANEVGDVADSAADKTGSAYQRARAIREHFLALEAKRIYETNIGNLCSAKEAAGIAASAMTEVRRQLEALAVTLSPLLGNLSDETAIKSLLLDEFEHVLKAMEVHFLSLQKGKHE